MSALPDIVIGSGPAGISAAEALLSAGRNVLMIDAGAVLPAAHAAAKLNLATRNPSEWTPADLAFLAGPGTAGRLPDKRSFGSTYPYDPASGATPQEVRGSGLKPSYAVGGLSTVWGSAMLPFKAADMASWPIGSADLREGYAAAARLMPLSAVHDDLADDFPLHREPDGSLQRSGQARLLLDRLGASRAQLAAEGLRFGQARLAVSAKDCVACGLCLEGCPHDLIFSARATLDRQRARGLAYEAGLVVKRVSERDGRVEVQALRADGSPRVLEGQRVFVAAGVLNTTEILLRSMDRRDRPVRIKDSQYVILPIVQWRGVARIRRERLHTLAQAFIELDDPVVSAHTVHMQAYGYSPLLRDMVMAKLGALAPVFPVDAVLGRLMVLQSYLHSDESGEIDVALRGCGADERIVLDGRPNAAVPRTVARLIAKLRRLRPSLGFSPIGPLAEIAEPGRGFHAGGSFPMAVRPGAGETDLVGRLPGFARVHLVDSSVFPSIPATTITFAIMANAYRIAAAMAAAGPP